MERYVNIQTANRVCKNHSLDLIIIPKSELIYLNYRNRKVCVLKQEKVPCNSCESFQEELYLSNPEAVEQAVLQMLKFIVETGYSDCRWNNNPIVDGKKIAILDLEEMNSPIWGIFERPQSKNSLISSLNEKQGEKVAALAKTMHPCFDEQMAENALVKRKEALKRIARIQEYHNKHKIHQGDERLKVNFQSLGLDDRFLKPVKHIVSEINRKIRKKSKDEGKIGKRYFWIEGKEIPWKMIHSWKGDLKKQALASITPKKRHYHQLYLYMSCDEGKALVSNRSFSIAAKVFTALVKHGYLFDFSEGSGWSYRIQA